MSAERGWIFGPPPPNPNRVEKWVERHRAEGHHPYPAPTTENPERWECKCDPDAKWTSVWRILTAEQIGKKFTQGLTAKRGARPGAAAAASDGREHGAPGGQCGQ
jgi:hypothetical protein